MAATHTLPERQDVRPDLKLTRPIRPRQRIPRIGREHFCTQIDRAIWKCLIPTKAIDLVESVRCCDTCCDIDDARLSQVLRNIFENAISTCPNPGRIEVECSDAEVDSQSALEVCVRDNGRGFPTELAEQIFEPFFTTKPSATGLGMAIAKQIVTDHGGRIATRNSPNSGAEFVLTLSRSVRS